MPLSEVNYALLRWAKDTERGILVPTLPKLPSFLQIGPQDKVVVTSMCSDGRKLEDQLGHQRAIHEQACGHRHMPHFVGNAGGPISIVPEQAMIERFPHRFVGPYTKSLHDLEELEIGCEAMRVNGVELIGHAPCRLATCANLDLFQIIRSTASAVPVVKAYLEQSELVKPITQELGLPVRVDAYIHLEQSSQFKTRAINLERFWLFHNQFESVAAQYREQGVAAWQSN